MSTVGIRALKQNASAVVAEAASGDIITITDRGRPVALLVPLVDSRVDALLASEHARPPLRRLRDLPVPARRHGARPTLTAELDAARLAERY